MAKQVRKEVKPVEMSAEALKIKIKYIGPGGVNYNRFGGVIPAGHKEIKVAEYFKALTPERENYIVAKLIKDANVDVEILTESRRTEIERVAGNIAFGRLAIVKD